MAPGQNTFSIIPNAPGAINGDLDTPQSRPNKRPMTSKQAKKAYQKANQGPKLSKAERRRQELFEQDRIRKEFEKEKNQARAKAARDRKKEKEEKERAAKKKKGLPLVDVHPSQDTIAWFVRGNGKKKQSNSAVSLSTVNKDDGDGDGRISSSDENEPEPSPKRQKTESPAPVPMDVDPVVDADPEYSPSPTGVGGDSMSTAQGLDTGEVPPPPEVNGSVERCPTPDHLHIDVDEPETIESLPDELFNELIDATDSSSKNEETAPNTDLPLPRDQKTPNSQPSSRPSDNCLRSPSPTRELLQEKKAEDSASLPSTQRPLQPLSTTEVNSRTNYTPKEPTPDRGKPITPINAPWIKSPTQVPKKVQPSVPTSRSFQHPKTPMGPPPIPPKFKSRSHVPSRGPNTPPFLVKQAHTPNSHSVSNPIPKPHEGYVHQSLREEHLPTSTQLFMLGHLDDFFPSPSQEVRELFDEPKLSIGMNSNTPKIKATYLTRSPPSRNLPTKSISNISNLNRLAPVAKCSNPKPSAIQNGIFSTHTSDYPSISAVNTQSSGNSDAFDMPFFSTQDFVLSSQDMKDLGDETMTPLGFKHVENSLQSSSTPGSPTPCVHNITQSHISAWSTTAVTLPPPKRAKGLERVARTVSTSDDYQPTYPRPPDGTVGCLKSSTLVRKNVSSLNPRIEKGVKPLAEAKSGNLPTISRGHPNKTPNTLQMKNDAEKLRNSPKPFFASSGREAHYKYVIERSKTTLWEGASTRQKAQEELEHFQRSEDERSNKLLAVRMTEDKDIHAADTAISNSESGPRDSTPRPHNPPKGPSQPRSINQLSGVVERSSQGQKTDEPNEKRQRQRQNQSRSSYEEMLEMLKRKEKDNQKQEQQPVPASQETDYGDAGLDDVLCEML
ncbi:hypothetical protein F4781DRAFT_395970 [Annulohypoxylon bovei var. microspora]|nr:hypothetical protein F4781DRAFT_395970 [Annulohypoxylon bovei var. microspora]